jgi:hypothetical protein
MRGAGALMGQVITIGVGARSGDAHRLSEWYEAAGREVGYQRALPIMLATAGPR